MTAILFALGSMLCAALNDVVFKLFATRKKSVGLYMSVIGMVWTLFFIFRCGGWEIFFNSAPSHLWLWGIIAGLFSSVANILLIEGMAKNEVGVCAAIYRLNMAPAVLLAFVLLGENPSPGKLAGIFFAICASILFFKKCGHESVDKYDYFGLWVIVLAALLRAGMGLAYKYALLPSVDANAFLAINGILWIVSGIIYHNLKGKSQASDYVVVWGYGLLSGILICGIVLFMALALQLGDASTVLPIAQLSFMVTALAGIAFLGESLTWRKAAGLAFAMLCIISMGLENSI